jgi:PAS domain S-box-containing protein
LNVNKKWLEELGYKRHEIIGRKIDLIMTPESSKRAFKEILPKFWMNGQVSNVPYQYVRKDGTLIDVLLDSAVMRDPVWGLVSLSVIRNVTEQRRAEKALLDSEQRFRAVFQGARDSIFIKNKAMQYTHVNPAMERLLGMSENNIIGKTAADIYGEQVGLHIQDVDSRVLSGESIEEEHSRTIHGEKLIFHDVRMPLRNAQDQIIGIFGISRNITERKRIEPTRSIPISEYPSPAMRATMEKAKFAAGTDGIVLLLGESGSGKDHLARWMHDNSKRASGPFFSINCAAVPHDLAESELFGHEAGAFTGARGRKRGLLELAEGGTLLLNEIGELSLPLQSKLLTFLDSRSFLRLGGEKSIRVNARLMAASHRDLQEEMLNGKFLEPLFYRLDVFTIRIPPLRERSQDMHILIRELTAQLATEMQFAHLPEIDPETLEKLAGYHWPGNIRELRNVLERALMLSCDDRLVISMPSSKTMDDWHFTAGFPENKNLHDLSSQLIKELCLEALRRSRGERKKAAALLGISRDSLYRFMKNLGIKSENRTHLSDNER